ncbi:hypothetical protein [Desertibaculum subflavum]|uniref:hypothetical protein n=1 Tax=Desertibaculum subflavum TaxID=2268458 RepID=UPI000E670087
MKLSAKAQRYVEAAIVNQGDARAVRLWREFVESGAARIPLTLLPLVIAALEAELASLREQIAQFGPDSDEHADLANDLHFVQAIGEDLAKQSSATTSKAQAV